MRVMELTPEAQVDRDDFDSTYADRGCTCFISPPCGACTHVGNPLNQAEDESCWQAISADALPEVVRAETGPFIGVDIAANGRDCTVIVSRSTDGRIRITEPRDLLDTATALIKAFTDMRTRRAAVANASIPPENRP